MSNIKGQELLDLLDLAQDDTQPTLSKRDARQVNIDVFIHSRPLEPGKARVNLYQIYTSYLEFSKKRMSFMLFVKYLRKAGFKVFNSRSVKYVKLNPIPLGLPDNYDLRKDPNELSGSKQRLNKSRYIGVWALPDGTFIARLLLDTGRYMPLGRHKTSKDAAFAYDRAVLSLHGRDAVLNFKHLWEGIINGTEAEVDFKYWEIKIKKAIKKYFKQEQHKKRNKDQDRKPEDSAS